MEERNNMVREFLKDRETNEQKYKTRTDDMIANFNKKMKALEKSLSFVEEEQPLPPGFSSVSIQTQLIDVKQTGVQVTLFTNDKNSNPQNTDISKVVDAVTSNVNEVAKERYLKESDVVRHRYMFQQNKTDLKCIDRALEILHKEINNDGNVEENVNQKQDLEEAVQGLVAAYLKDNPSENRNSARKSMLAKYIKTGDQSILPANESKDATLNELEPYRQKFKDVVNARYFGDKKQRAENDLQKRLDLLYNTCKEMEGSKDKLKHVMDSLIQKTGTSSSHLKTLVSEANQEEPIHEVKDIVSRLTRALGDPTLLTRALGDPTLLTRALGDPTLLTRALGDPTLTEDVRSLVECMDMLKEQEKMLASQVACSSDCYWKIRAIDLCNLNKNLLSQKEVLLKELQGSANIKGEGLFGLIPQHPQVIVDIEPKIGKDLIRDLEFIDWLSTTDDTESNMSRIKAVDRIHFCEEPIESILKRYEDEIHQLKENRSKGRVLEEIYKEHLPQVTQVPRNTYQRLEEKLQCVNNEKETKNFKHQEILTEIKGLRERKMDLFKAENDLQQQRKSLGNTVTSLNKQITNRLVYSERIKEGTTDKDWISEVNKQIKRLEDKVSDQQYLATLDTNDELTSDVTKRIGNLRRGLNLLVPFVNKNKLPALTREDVLVPTEGDIDQILKEKDELSRLLLDAENRIQEIITSEGYESSVCGSGTMENIEEVQFDVHSPTGVEMKDFLNNKLGETKAKLAELNKEIAKREIDPKRIVDIKTSCRGLSRKIRDIEKRIRLEPMSEQTSNIIEIDEEIARLTKELSKHGCENTCYDKKQEEQLLELREHAVQRFKELISNEKRQESEHSVSVALKCLLGERDRTHHKVLSLQDDIANLKVISGVLAESGLTTMADKCTELSGQILEKKTTNVNRIMATANKRLNYFISLVRIKMKEKLEEASKSNWENKERVSREEKQKLGTCLKGVVQDIQNIEVDLEEYEEYKMNGDVGSCGEMENEKLKVLIQQKRKVMRNLGELGAVDGEKKELLIKQLCELNDKLEDEEVILHQRMAQLQSVKKELEVKLSDCIEIDDLQQILSELDRKESLGARATGEQHSDCELTKLVRERESVAENVKQVLYHSPQEKGKLKKMSDLLENIDVSILMHVDEILEKLNSAPHLDSENQLEAYDLLASTANAFTFMRDQEELREALAVAKFSDSYSASVQEVSATRDEILKLEDLKRKIDSLQHRDIKIQDVEKLFKMKELNETKLEKLLKKIKDLNQLVEIQRKFDRKLRRSSEPTLSDFEDVSVTTEKINNELKSIIQNYDNTISTRHNSNNDDGRKPVFSGSRQKKNNTSQKLNSILEKRDQMLNQLFEIEREMAGGVASKIRQRHLVEQKNEITQKLEAIEESIVSSEYLNMVEGRNQSVERSFSPRSTSSRASFTIHLEERDGVLKELFRLKKNKEELRVKVIDEASSQSKIKEIETQEQRICQRLQEMNVRLFGELTTIEDGPVDIQESTGSPVEVEGGSLDEEIDRLEKECNDSNAIYLRKGKEEGDQIHHESIVFREPPESDCLKEIKQLEKKIKIESMKKALRSLEEEKAIIESTMKCGGSGISKEKTKKLADLKAELEQNKIQLAEEQTVLDMLLKRRSYEGKMTDLHKQIRDRSGGGHSENAEDDDKNSEPILLKEHKQNKVKLEKKLDKIDSTIHKYFGSIKHEIDATLQSKENVEKETLQAVKDCKSTLMENVGSTSNTTSSFQDVSIKDLLDERTTAMHRIEEIDRVLNSFEQSQRKDELTKKLRRCYEEEKRSSDEVTGLECKQEILKEKLEEMEIIEEKEAITLDKTEKGVEKGNAHLKTDHLRKVLGEHLFIVMLSPEITEDDSTLYELKEYLGEHTLEDYITDIKNLSQIQSDQVSLVKTELTEAKAKVKILQNELQEASKVQDQFRTKLGGSLFDLVGGFGDVSADLEDVALQLNRGQTLRNILNDNCMETENLRSNTTEVNLKLKRELEEYQLKNGKLQQTNVDLKRSLEETSECQSVREVSLLHEVESLREDLTLSTDRMNSLVESEQNLRREIQSMQKRLQQASEDKSSFQDNLNEENKTVERLKDQLSQMERKDEEMYAKNGGLIESQGEEIQMYQRRVQQMETAKNEMQKALDRLKGEYLALSSEHSNEVLNHQMKMKEMRSKLQEEKGCLVREKEALLAAMEEENQKLVEKIGEQEGFYETNVQKHLHKVHDKEMEAKAALLEIKRLKDQNHRLEEQKMNFVAENRRMVTKSKEIDSSHQKELTSLRDEIKKLNSKIEGLVKELQTKTRFEDMHRNLEAEIQEKRARLLEQKHVIQNHEKTQGLMMLSINNELNAVKLENDGLSEEVLKLKHELKRHHSIEALTENLEQKEEALNAEVSRFNEEKMLFEESVQDFLRRKSSVELKAKQEHQQMSLKLLKTTQQERDRFSDELIKVNRELHQAKNEARKLRMTLKEKEQTSIHVQSTMVRAIEDDFKKKLGEQGKLHDKEKETIIFAYQEERLKWEDEMDSLKTNLQKETLKKLAEQRNDYEVELQKQIKLYLQHNQEELSEERDKNVELEKQKSAMVRQFDEEKARLNKKFDSQKITMTEIIKRLLRHLMMVKKQRER